MAGLKLNFASALYDRMEPLYTGEIKPEGIDLNFIPIELPRPIFDRMSGGDEFDVAEYSSSEYVQRFAAGKCNFVALPVFPSRSFRHDVIAINKKSGIKTPKDLEGKRVGVALYTMTAALFIRGLLQHEYGVDLSKIKWVQGAINSAGSHGDPHVLPLLKKVDIEHIAPGKSLDDMLVSGEVDCTMGTSVPRSILNNPNIGRLLPNYYQDEKDYYAKTKIFPIMHLVAIRKDIYEKHPFVATSLYNAFVQSKNLALKKMFSTRALRYMMPFLPAQLDEIRDVFGDDPWPYGVEDNRPTLEALVQYMHDQHFIAKKMPIEDLFAKTYGHTEPAY
ncbi:MAG TPA: ABC transporter substrate-binding protein [Xanthobacteraceae bacterium]|jgi:4,5-dihydroxyphthalate decarboxylase|nr:ABC transporter substrate-binding protein [Xanthobacteraceae bacterium]